MSLREAVEEAIVDLEAAHRPLVVQPGKSPIGCELCYPGDSDWPCVSAMVVDDLRRALYG